MVTASSTDGPAFHTRSDTQHTSSSATSTPHPDTSPQLSQEPTTTPKPLTVDHLDALLQMQRTDPFCKYISKRLLNGKAPYHEFDTFIHVKGLLYKHVNDIGKKVPCIGHSKILEVYSISGSSQQTGSPR